MLKSYKMFCIEESGEVLNLGKKVSLSSLNMRVCALFLFCIEELINIGHIRDSNYDLYSANNYRADIT